MTYELDPLRFCCVEAVEDYIAKTTVIKSVNMRTQAQPYLDELIADLSNLPRHIDHPELDEIIDKWSTK